MYKCVNVCVFVFTFFPFPNRTINVQIGADMAMGSAGLSLYLIVCIIFLTKKLVITLLVWVLWFEACT